MILFGLMLGRGKKGPNSLSSDGYLKLISVGSLTVKWVNYNGLPEFSDNYIVVPSSSENYWHLLSRFLNPVPAWVPVFLLELQDLQNKLSGRAIQSNLGTKQSQDNKEDIMTTLRKEIHAIHIKSYAWT